MMTPEQENMLKELHQAVVGNESIGHIGLVKRVNALEVKESKRVVRDATRAGFFSAIIVAINEFGKYIFRSF